MRMNVTELKNELRNMRGDANRRGDEISQYVGVNEHRRYLGFSISDDDQRVVIVVRSTMIFPDSMQSALDAIVADLNKGGDVELTTTVEPGVIHCAHSVDFSDFICASDAQIISLFFVALPARVMEAIALAEAVREGKTVVDVLDHRQRAIENAATDAPIEVNLEDDES